MLDKTSYEEPGREPWGATHSVFFAVGPRCDTVVGASDRLGGYPTVDPQRHVDMAATIYQVLRLSKTIK